MKKYKHLARLFSALAVLLSNVMCAVVAYSYCTLQWGGRYEGYSAPPDAAFVYCIPYGAGIVICFTLAWIFNKKRHKPI